MKIFSDALSEYIYDRNINISALSAETGIERTLIHKFISGKRTPSDIRSVIRISDGLMLSFDERAALCDSYRFTYMGADNYERCKKIKKIADYLSNLPDPLILRSSAPSEPLIPAISKDRLSTEMMIKRIISDDSTKKISLIAPPAHTVTESELISACLNRPELQIVQLLTMSNTSVDFNISILESIIPLLVFCDKYTPLINYCSVSERINSAALMPNLILTEKYAFNFSNTCDKGILHTRTDILKLYNLVFSDIEEKSSSLIDRKISSAPGDSETAVKINDNLYIESNERRLSLVYRTGSFWSSILIYEQSLRKAIKESLEFIMPLSMS